MAGESEDDDSKTEEPSQKKLDDAINRGDVVKSQELSTFFVLSAATVFVAFMSTNLSRDLTRSLAAFIDHADQIAIDRRGLTEVFIHLEIGRAHV